MTEIDLIIAELLIRARSPHRAYLENHKAFMEAYAKWIPEVMERAREADREVNRGWRAEIFFSRK